MITNYTGQIARQHGGIKKVLLALFAALLAILALAPPAEAAIEDPPSFSRNVVVFPERDFVVVDGADYAGDSLKVSVLRNDDQGNPVVIGSATGTADGAGFLEINHPGGVCWGESPNTPNATPDILPGDVIQVDVLDTGGTPTGDGSKATTRNVAAEAVFINDAGELEVHGTAKLANGERIPLDDIEQRIINPDLVDTAVGRRDMRATSDGAGLGTISYNGATGNKWTAKYMLSQFTAAEAEEIKNIAVEGQTRIMSWQGLDPNAALERVGITIFEVDELGGPGFGGCAAGANYGVTDFGRDAINEANQGQDLIVTGSSFDASAVNITLDDENPDTQAVQGTVTQQPDPDTGHQTWKATFDAAGIQNLDDGMLTASGTYTIPGEVDPITGLPTGPRNIKGADRQILKDTVNPGSPSATPSGNPSYPTWQSVKLSKPAGEDRLSKIYYTTNGSAPSLASRVFGENILVTDDQTIRAKIVDRAGNEGPADQFAYDVQLAPDAIVDAPPRVTPVNATESNATGISTPPAFPHEVVIFPERDFVVADGYEPFKKLNFKVVRDGHVISTASGTADGAGFLEVNHPGGVCWNGVTPDIQPGDEVFVTDTQGNGDKNSTINVTADPAQEVGDTIVVHGTAVNANGGQIDLSLVEQRIIQPDFRSDPGSLIGRRDIRADANGGVVDRPGGSGQLSYDAPDSTNWTAVYTGLNQRERELALEGQTRVLSWLATDADANRLGITIFEVGETGGPGFGGCPNAATFAATGANHTAVNTSFNENPDSVLEISGVSDNASAVAVELTDGQNSVTADSAANPPTVIITPAPTASHPNAQLWKATFSRTQVSGLNEGTLTASGTYTVPVDPPTTPPTTSSTLGVEFEILKDTIAPLASGLTATPSANTDANPSYPIWQAITLEHADDPETAIHFSLNGNDPTPNSRIASSQVVLDARTDPYVLKALAVDSAGNKSAVNTFDYKIVDGLKPVQPGAPDLIDASDTGVSNADNITSDSTPAFSGTAEARSTVKLFKVTGTGTTEALTQVGDATAGDDGKYSVTASTLSDGDHAVFVTATDASGNESVRSGVLSITVDTTAPNTIIASGPTGSVNVTSASFGLASSEPQGARFRCSLDGAAFATCLSPKTYTGLAPNKTHAFRAQTTDVAGNIDATPASRNWTIDTVRPTVKKVTPAAGTRNIAAGTNITATFSERMRAGSLNKTTVRLVRNGTTTRVNATVTYNAGTRVVTLNPSVRLVRGATYTATIVGGANGTKDVAGNALAVNKTWSFTVIP